MAAALPLLHPPPRPHRHLPPLHRQHLMSRPANVAQHGCTREMGGQLHCILSNSFEDTGC